MPGLTDEIGLDVGMGDLIPAGQGDLMSYCSRADQRRWPTGTLLQKLCEKMEP
jgi:hypothetical protein